MSIAPTPSVGFARRLVSEEFDGRAFGLAPLAAGEWSRAFSMTLDGAKVVLRIGPYGDDYAKDAIVSERAIGGIPVPRVLYRGTSGQLSYAISVRATGIGFDDLSAECVEAALGGVLRMLDLIADIDVSSTAGYGIWTPTETAPHQSWADALLAIEVETPRIPGWRDALARSEIGVEPFDAGLAALRRLAPDLPDQRRLVHGDILSRNLLIESNAVAAVLDWGNALYGDHLYDAAWLIYWWPWNTQWQSIDIRTCLYTHWRDNGGTPPDVERRLRAYQIHIGLDAIAYSAFKGRWDDVRLNARAVLELTKVAE